MRQASILLGILAILPLSLPAQENEPKQEYAEFSRLIHGMVVKQLPKEFEDTSGWGLTIPAEPNLRLPKLRTFIKVGDKLEMPHGAWRRFKGKIEDPAKNLKIVVKEFKQVNDKSYRVVLDVDVIIFCQGEWQQWQKGIALIGAQGAGDANVTAAIVCDVGVSLNLKKFPPDLNLEPKVAELGLNLVDFKTRGGPVLTGEKGTALANDLKDMARGMLKSSEPFLKDLANQAIAQSIKDGKGAISAGEIMKALPKPSNEDKK